jgi:signal transduction histidine kinase
MLGYSHDELLKLRPADIVPQEETQRIAPAIREIMARSAYYREWQFQRKDGSAFAAEVIGTAMPDGNLMALIRDITERKRAEAEVRHLHEELQRHAADLEQRVAERTVLLEAAKIRAESADRVKSAFLATMSHELRTPLNSIIGFTGILLQQLPGPLNSEQEKQLGIVRNASRHLLALINDVLDISKVEAGELHLANEDLDLRALLERLGAVFAPQAERRGLAFTLDIGENAAIAAGDARRDEQVLINLLSNALKFTPSGNIALTLARADDSFVIAVADTGVGIRSEDMDKLFRPFSQIETGLPELREGTGLGLAISMRLAQAMGGRIAAESAWGKGSRFAFTLPAGGKA